MMLIWIFIIGVGFFQVSAMAKGEENDQEAFAKSGSEAEQALNAIKIVKAFGQESHEVEKFEKHLEITEEKAGSQAWIFGISKGIFESTLYFIPFYGLLLGGLFVFHDVSNLVFIIEI